MFVSIPATICIEQLLVTILLMEESIDYDTIELLLVPYYNQLDCLVTGFVSLLPKTVFFPLPFMEDQALLAFTKENVTTLENSKYRQHWMESYKGQSTQVSNCLINEPRMYSISQRLQEGSAQMDRSRIVFMKGINRFTAWP